MKASQGKASSCQGGISVCVSLAVYLSILLDRYISHSPKLPAHASLFCTSKNWVKAACTAAGWDSQTHLPCTTITQYNGLLNTSFYCSALQPSFHCRFSVQCWQKWIRFSERLCPIVTASSGTPEVLPSASHRPSYLKAVCKCSKHSLNWITLLFVHASQLEASDVHEHVALCLPRLLGGHSLFIDIC